VEVGGVKMFEEQGKLAQKRKLWGPPETKNTSLGASSKRNFCSTEPPSVEGGRGRHIEKNQSLKEMNAGAIHL